MTTETVRGYVTVERNIVGLKLNEMEAKLGLRPGRLVQGARILILQRQPVVGEFVFAGSTRYSGAQGLVNVEQRRGAASTEIPHAWFRQRLVKVVPKLPHTPAESYPDSASPIEQWELLVPIPAAEVCQLQPHQAYWPRG